MSQHVSPINDLREHDTTDEHECWCEPEYTYINGDWLVSHNSADGRELRERVLQ